MTQLDDLQGYTNANMPLRPIQWRWDNSDVAYDGDPNDVAAPPILDLSPPGTLYLQSNNSRWLKNIDGSWAASDPSLFRNEGAEIYVDLAGDDANPGTLAAPIRTIYEATLRTPLLGKAAVHLSAGTHVLTDNSAIERHTVIQSLSDLEIFGATPTIESFTVASVSENVITKDGSTPDWTIDEFRGKRISVSPWGPPWTYRIPILSNTADTLTVCVVYDTMTDGTFLPPVPGEVIPITSNASVIASSPTNPSSQYSNLYCNGSVTFNDIDFDSRINPGGYTAAASWLPNGYIGFYHCGFFGWANAGASLTGEAYLYSPWAEDCYSLCVGDGKIAVQDLVAVDCTVPIAPRHGEVTIYGGVWAQDCYGVMGPGGKSHIIDYTSWIWADSIGRYVQFDAYVQYEKRGRPLRGWPSHDTMGYVFTTLSGRVGIVLAYSENCTLLTTSDFFYFDGVRLSLADYIAGNAPAVAPEVYADDKGNNVMEYY